MADRFMLNVNLEGLRLELRVNHVPVIVRTDGGAFSSVEVLNRWLKPGENAVTVEFALPRGNPPGDVDLAGMTARMYISRIAAGQSVSERIWSLEFPDPQAEQLPKLPARVKTTLEVRNGVPATRFWSEAEPVQLDEVTRADVLDLMKRLITALDARDFATASDLMDVRATDTGLLFGLSKEDARRSQTSFLESGLENRDVRLQPFSPGDFSLELCAENRLLALNRWDGRPSIVCTGSHERSLQIRLYAARLQGVWCIVR